MDGGRVTFPDTEPVKTADPPERADPLAKHDGLTDGLTDPLTQTTQAASDPAKPSPVDTLLPAILRVVDPAVFLNNKSYNASIENKKSSKGFFELAIAECQRIAGELAAVCDDHPDFARAQHTIHMLNGYANLYASIQAAGSSAEDAQVVAAQLNELEPWVYGMDPELLGSSAYDVILNAYNELGVFVDSWSDVKASYGGNGQLSAGMWGAFLQTVERQRQILNQYGLLEERGGDTTNTSRRRIAKENGSGMVMDADEAQSQGAGFDNGGLMVSALESYGMHARNTERMKEQIYEIQQLILSGEFETMEEAVEAFKKSVGGGETSQAFQEQLDALARGTWSIAMGESYVQEGADHIRDAHNAQVKAESELEKSDKNRSGAIHSYVDHKAAADDRDKPAADEAYDKAEAFKSLAEGSLRHAENLIEKDVPESLSAAADAHAAAKTHLQSARNYVDAVDTERYAVLSSGVHKVEVRAGKVEDRLKKNEEARLKVEQTNEALQENLKARQDQPWAMERVEVPAPDTAAAEEAGGSNITTEAYSDLEVKLEGTVPGAPFMKLFGGYKAGVSKVNEKGERWTKTSQEIHCGVKIDLWLVTFAIKYIGSLKGSLRGGSQFPGIGETLSRVNAELSNLESALEWDSGGYLPKLTNAIEYYPDAVESKVWEPLYALAPAVAADGAGGREAFDQQVDQSAAHMEELWGSLTSKTGYHAALFNSVSNLAGFWEALKVAIKLNDGDSMADEIRALKHVDDDAVTEDLYNQHAGWKENSDEIEDGITGQLDKVKFLKNDPDVEVETSNAVELSAEVGSPSVASGKVSYRHVWTKSDGDGKYMNTKTDETGIWKVGFETPKAEGDASLTVNYGKDKKEFELGLKIPGEKPKASDEQTAVAEISTFWRSMKSGPSGEAAYKELLKSSQKWAEQFGKKWTEQYAMSAKFITKDYVNLGVKLVWENGELTTRTVSLGYEAKAGVKAELGVVEGEISLTSGTKISWDI